MSPQLAEVGNLVRSAKIFLTALAVTGSSTTRLHAIKWLAQVETMEQEISRQVFIAQAEEKRIVEQVDRMDEQANRCHCETPTMDLDSPYGFAGFRCNTCCKWRDDPIADEVVF